MIGMIVMIRLTAAPTSAPSPSSLCRGHTWRIWADMGDIEDDGGGGKGDDDDDDDDEGNLLKKLKSVTTDKV